MRAQYSKISFNSLCILIAMFSFVSEHSLAAVIASISTNQVAKGEVFLLKIVSDERLNSDEVDFSVLDDDFFMGTPNFGSSRNSINGKTSVRSEWNLSLAPLRSGILTIPSFIVGNDTTDPIQITSTVDPSEPRQQDLIEFQTKLSQKEIYPGEIARLATRLIVKTDPRQLQNPSIEPPTHSGKLEIEPIGESKQYQTVIDGLAVTIVDQAYQVSAQEPGQYVINGPKINVIVLNRNGRTGATKLIPVDTQRKQIQVNVLAKPTKVKGNWLPSSNLKLNQVWQDETGAIIEGKDAIKTQVGSPLTRILTLSVENVAQSHLPNIEVIYPGSIRLYEESPQFSSDNHSVIMTIKQVLIAKEPGDISLPPVNISWWNTREKRPETAKVKGLFLTATQSDSQVLSLMPSQTTESKQNPNKIEVEKVIIEDAGIWPYLTALFALLWLTTVLLLLRHRRPVRDEQPQINTDDDTIKQLITALKNSDGIQSQALLDRWIEENHNVSKALVSEMRLELKQMMKSIYQENEQHWDSAHLIRLLKKANKRKQKKPSEPALANL